MAWTYKIELNAAIAEANERFDLSRHEEPCPKEVLESFAAEVEKAPPLAHFGPMFRRAKTIAEGNRILERVFGEADRGRAVWCGMWWREKPAVKKAAKRKAKV